MEPLTPLQQLLADVTASVTTLMGAIVSNITTLFDYLLTNPIVVFSLAIGLLMFIVGLTFKIIRGLTASA